MKIARIRNVKLPTKASINNAGIDFYVPEFDTQFLKDMKKCNEGYLAFYNQTFSIKPGQRIFIPSGIKVQVPCGYVLITFNQSGTPMEHKINVLPHVIDDNYQKEIYLSIINLSDRNFLMRVGDKLLQFILVKIGSNSVIEVSKDDLYNEDCDKENIGFGDSEYWNIPKS